MARKPEIAPIPGTDNVFDLSEYRTAKAIASGDIWNRINGTNPTFTIMDDMDDDGSPWVDIDKFCYQEHHERMLEAAKKMANLVACGACGKPKPRGERCGYCEYSRGA